MNGKPIVVSLRVDADQAIQALKEVNSLLASIAEKAKSGIVLNPTININTECDVGKIIENISRTLESEINSSTSIFKKPVT